LVDSALDTDPGSGVVAKGISHAGHICRQVVAGGFEFHIVAGHGPHCLGCPPRKTEITSETGKAS
jgi:hypothetical protein